MHIVFSDEESRLTAEIRDLMREAALAALAREVFVALTDYDDDEIPYCDAPISAQEVERSNLEIGVTIVGNDEIRELNREYRSKDSVTDVLSFPQFRDLQEVIDTLANERLDDAAATDEQEDIDALAEEPDENGFSDGACDASWASLIDDSNEDDVVLLGDVVLCYDRALAQAQEYGTGVTRELVYLFTHSILHLLGYDHEEEAERRIMRAKEEDIMNAIEVYR